MSKSTQVAAIQMYARPGTVSANLVEAERLVRDAAAAGAQLVVLPEFFNTGYQLSDDSFVLAEWRQGRTWRWVTSLAVELGIYLAGGFLARKDGEVYNTLLLSGPDGRTWDYDKRHPFAWERAFVRPGRQPIIAATPLGRIGLLMSWDCAFADSFSALAGKIDLLLIASCAPRFHDTVLTYPDGTRLSLAGLNPIARRIRDGSEDLFSDNIRRQAAYLGVPVVHACPAPTGQLRTTIPRAHASYLTMTALNPLSWLRLEQADLARIDIGFFAETGIIHPDGRMRSAVTGANEVVVEEIFLATAPPQPVGRPAPPVPTVAYLVERLLEQLMVPVYENAMGRQTLYTARFLLTLAAVLFVGYWLRQLRRPRA